jgi:DNA-3-methyladenine glycosylase II
MAEIILKPLPPFRLDLIARLLRRVAINEMDRWDGSAWRRTLVIDGAPVDVTAVQEGTSERPRLVVRTSGARLTPQRKDALAATLRKMLGLELDLSEFYRMAAKDKRLWELADSVRGLKPPRMPSVFEALVNGISCQQITLVLGITLLNRITAAYGTAGEEGRAFPLPEQIARARVERFKGFGFSGRKAEYIIGAAKGAASGEIDLEGLSGLDDDTAVERLLDLRGVGRWTAQYVALRGLGRLDVYPADDVGSQAKLQAWLGLEERPDYDGVGKAVSRWRPYRGLIYLMLFAQAIVMRDLTAVENHPQSHRAPPSGAGRKRIDG